MNYLSSGKEDDLIPVGCHVNVILLRHESDLPGIKTSESEHPDLLDNVAPVSRCICQK